MRLSTIFAASFLWAGINARAESPVQANEIEFCSNGRYQVSVRVESGGKTDAIVSDSNANVLGRYQVVSDSDEDIFQGQGFFIYIYSRLRTPQIRNAHFRAEDLKIGLEDQGELLICNAKPPPLDFCWGGQDRVCKGH